LFNFNANFDVIYVSKPGFGSRLSGRTDFWAKIDQQLSKGGYLLVVNNDTDQPNNAVLIKKGLDADFLDEGGISIYQKSDNIFEQSAAMASGVDNAITKKGGIDLTPANMNLQTKNAGSEIKFHMDPTVLKQLQNAPGFVPVIINIQPLKSLQEFLGLTQLTQSNVG
jgi:hypothetical protein